MVLALGISFVALSGIAGVLFLWSERASLDDRLVQLERALGDLERAAMRDRSRLERVAALVERLGEVGGSAEGDRGTSTSERDPSLDAEIEARVRAVEERVVALEGEAAVGIEELLLTTDAPGMVAPARADELDRKIEELKKRFAEPAALDPRVAESLPSSGSTIAQEGPAPFLERVRSLGLLSADQLADAAIEQRVRDLYRAYSGAYRQIEAARSEYQKQLVEQADLAGDYEEIAIDAPPEVRDAAWKRLAPSAFSSSRTHEALGIERLFGFSTEEAPYLNELRELERRSLEYLFAAVAKIGGE